LSREARGKLEVAKNLLDNGFSVEQTAQYAIIDCKLFKLSAAGRRSLTPPSAP
jgi:hypothetical protein